MTVNPEESNLRDLGVTPDRGRGASAFTADRLEGRPVPPREWHVPGMIPGRNVTLLGGHGGTGKSTAALQLAVATVTGKEWMGQKPRQGRVLYLSAEDDSDELHRRLDALCVFYGVALSDLCDLKLWPLADGDAVLAYEGRQGGAIETTPLWSDLEAMAMALEPTLIVLDALADVFGGNENDRAQARQFVGLLRGLAMTTGAAVLVLAHPSLTGMTNGSGLSGSTAWNNSVRSRLDLSAPNLGKEVQGDPAIRTLSIKKANYAAIGADLQVRLTGGGFVLEGQTGDSFTDLTLAHLRVDRLFLDLLTTYQAQGRRVSDAPGSNFAPSMFAKDPAAKGTTAPALRAAMNRLFNSGDIKVETTGPASRQLHNLVRMDRG